MAGTAKRVSSLFALMAWAAFAAPTLASGAPGVLFREGFEDGLGDRWVERGFPSIARKNAFSLAAEPDGNHYLKVESADSYSGKGVYLEFSPQRCPDVHWRWIVSDVLTDADITRKEGDDAAAKLYVVFAGPSWWNPLDKRILVYVWDNAAPVGAVLPNTWLPETERMVVLESGPARRGQWVSERVDLTADFARAFPGELPGRVQGLAFLADTDNTHARVWAGFDDLVIQCSEGAGRAAR